MPSRPMCWPGDRTLHRQHLRWTAGALPKTCGEQRDGLASASWAECDEPQIETLGLGQQDVRHRPPRDRSRLC